jgi:hypothetical protein
MANSPVFATTRNTVQFLNFSVAKFNREINAEKDRVIAGGITLIDTEIIKDLDEAISEFIVVPSDSAESNEIGLRNTYYFISVLREAEREVSEHFKLLESAKNGLENLPNSELSWLTSRKWRW